tara:strand:+ start:5159 stop:5305 length:147 start_codon:yes stop_codon:yes gene_type:complete
MSLAIFLVVSVCDVVELAVPGVVCTIEIGELGDKGTRVGSERMEQDTV